MAHVLSLSKIVSGLAHLRPDRGAEAGGGGRPHNLLYVFIYIYIFIFICNAIYVYIIKNVYDVFLHIDI